MKRGFRGVPRPLLPVMLSLANPSAGQEAPSVTQHQPSSSTFRKAILTLVERVKILEVALKRKTKRILLFDSEEEETEAQGRKFHDLDPLVSLLQELVTPSKTPSKTVNASGEEQVEDISPTTLEAAAILTKVKKIKSVNKGKRYKRRKSSKESAGTGLDFEEVKSSFKEVNTGGIKVSAGIEEINTDSLNVNTGIDPVTTDSIRVSVPSPNTGRREGKAPITKEEETQASRKTKEQILQKEAGLAKAIRLDALEKALEKEEVVKQVHLDSLLAQRMAEEQELTEEQKKRKAKRFGDEGTQPTEEKIEEDKDDKPTKKTGKRRKQIARKGFHTDHDRDESEDSDEANEEDDSTSDYVYMLIERKYPLSAEVCKAMLDMKLQRGKPDEDCYKLLKMMEKQAGAKGLTSPEQTATGKGMSNPFMAIMVCQKPYGIQLTNVSRTES
ncbi:hypothetical protein Tco_0240919 [Tanacetum coccineum]